MSRKPPIDPSPVADFEASLGQLEQLVEKMEHGELSLEESLAAYERGVGLYRRCQTALEHAELRVRLLTDPGNPEKAELFPAGAPPSGPASAAPDA
ncbi:MAG: xseB [Xanthomonadaceae bacterium]|nr:xseB [Xanthomonadaceae bacterium]